MEMLKRGKTVISVPSLCGIVKLNICTKGCMDTLMGALTGAETSPEELRDLLRCLAGDIPQTEGTLRVEDLPMAEVYRVLADYCDKVHGIIADNPVVYRIPSSAQIEMESMGAEPCLLPPCHVAEKITADHLRVSIPELDGMDYLSYRAWLAEAVKYNLSKTEHGVELLNSAYYAMLYEDDRRTMEKDGTAAVIS